MTLLTHKLGGFSALRINASLEDLRKSTADLWFDLFTGPAIKHALQTEDGEALRCIYRIFLDQGFQPRSLIHELPQAAQMSREEENYSSDLLAARLVKEDINRLYQTPSIYTKEPASLISGETPILPAAFFYIMQPGVFAFYELQPAPSLQLKRSSSFASTLQTLLKIRKNLQLASAELIDVLPVKQKGVVLLLHRLPGGNFSLSAVNFSRSEIVETIQHSLLIGKWVINAVSGQTEPKLFERDRFDLHLESLDGKVLIFQEKYAAPT